jgi:hypothetical protein
MTQYIDLNGYYIFDSYGVSKIKLSGQYNAETLASRLISE